MNILALETASIHCSVALAIDNEITSLENQKPHSHTETILPMVDELLKNHDLQISDLDAIAFDCGPGSFTGLRIGAGVAQGLALAHDTPIIKVSSLAAMCHQLTMPYCAVALDARMDEVYFAPFINQTLSQEAKVLKPQDIALDENNDWFLLGNGWGAYPIPTHLTHYQKDTTISPHAKDIAALSRDADRLSLEHALPTYTRNI